MTKPRLANLTLGSIETKKALRAGDFSEELARSVSDVHGESRDQEHLQLPRAPPQLLFRQSSRDTSYTEAYSLEYAVNNLLLSVFRLDDCLREPHGWLTLS